MYVLKKFAETLRAVCRAELVEYYDLSDLFSPRM